MNESKFFQSIVTSLFIIYFKVTLSGRNVSPTRKLANQLTNTAMDIAAGRGP